MNNKNDPNSMAGGVKLKDEPNYHQYDADAKFISKTKENMAKKMPIVKRPMKFAKSEMPSHFAKQAKKLKDLMK